VDPVEQYLIVEGATRWSALTDVDEDAAYQALEEVVPSAVETDRPLPELDTGHDVLRETSDGAVSQKESNEDVKIDIRTAIVAMAETGPVISGEPVTIGCGIAALSAIMIEEMTEELSPTAGFLYATAYNKWGLSEPIQQSKVVETVCDRADTHPKFSAISATEAKNAIRELADIDCLDIINHEDGITVELKERCTVHWT
jgi:hypothetical protein